MNEWYKIHRMVVYEQLSYLLSSINKDWEPMKEELGKMVNP